MAVREWDGEVIFLRRVVEQPAAAATESKSRGSPDCPKPWSRARVKSWPTSRWASWTKRGKPASRIALMLRAGAGQLGLFTPAERRVVDELKTLEIDRLTPIEALNALARAVGRLKQGGDQ